jgi:hypothetical protein
VARHNSCLILSWQKASSTAPDAAPIPHVGSFTSFAYELFSDINSTSLSALSLSSRAARSDALLAQTERLRELLTELAKVRGVGGVLRTKPGSEAASFQWGALFAPFVLPVRATIEWLWDGKGKSHILQRCGELGILQGRKGTGSGGQEFGNMTINLQKPHLDSVDKRRVYTSSALETWQTEAELENASGAQFRKFLIYKAECAKRDIKFVHDGDIFMRFYRALSAIALHRDGSWFLARIVGNSGADRFVDFLLQELKSTGADLSATEVCEYLVEHGWGYALLAIGSGHAAFKRAAQLPGMREKIDLAVAHAVRQTIATCPVTMASVADIHKSSCGGDACLAVQRQSEAVIATLLLTGGTLDGAMETPQLPTPPCELQISEKDNAEQIRISRRGGLATRNNWDFPYATHLIRCHCSHCNEAYWLFASPRADGTDTALAVCYSTAKHVPGCVAAAFRIHVSVRLSCIDKPPPRFAKAGLPYQLKHNHGGVERWLIPTEYEELIDDSDDDSDDSSP